MANAVFDGAAALTSHFRRQSEDLKKSHDQVLQNFSEVKVTLKNAREIGEGHPLCADWDSLREEYRRMYRKIQDTATKCSSLLAHFANVVVPLTQPNSRASRNQKTVLIDEFISVMTAIMESAQRSTDDFSKLAKKIHEDFPYRVEKAINQFKPPFWSFMNLFSIVTWGANTVKDVCDQVGKMLQGFAESIGAIFNGLVDRIDSISYAGICIQFRVNIPAMCNMIYSKKRDPPPKYQAQTLKVVDVVKITAGKIYDELRVHETVSESVRTVCLGLVENVQRARRYIAGTLDVPKEVITRTMGAAGLTLRH